MLVSKLNQQIYPTQSAYEYSSTTGNACLDKNGSRRERANIDKSTVPTVHYYLLSIYFYHNVLHPLSYAANPFPIYV